MRESSSFLFGALWTICFLLGCGCSTGALAESDKTNSPNPVENKAEPSQPTSAVGKDERLSRKTPVGTLRLFMLGVLLTNEQLVKATIVPVSEDDFAYLMQKTKNLRSTPKQLKERCASLKVRSLKPGDVVTLPGGKKVTVSDEEVSDNRIVLLPENHPIPTRLYKAKGYWWVDASPVIAGRKAAGKVSKERVKDQPTGSQDRPVKEDNQSEREKQTSPG